MSQRLRRSRRWPMLTAIALITALCALALGAGSGPARTHDLDPNAVDGAYAMPD